MKEYRITIHLKTETGLSQYEINEIKQDLECEINCWSDMYDIEGIEVEESLTKEEGETVHEYAG